MIHHRQRLPFGFEASDDLLGVHPRFDQLQGYRPTNGLLLPSHIDNSHTSLADLLHQLVRADLLQPQIIERLWSRLHV